jgi:hypothetical protein
MHCGRCKGLMVSARYSDYYQVSYEWRCLNCGAIVFPPSFDRLTALEVKRRLGGVERRYMHSRSR